MIRALLFATPLLLAVGVLAQEAPRLESPHGAMDLDCGLCHQADAWTPARISPDFDHDRYGMPLRGSHRGLGCGSCHASMEFGEASAECAACHDDVHRGELGQDCERCHGTRSFIDPADQIRLHRLGRFPLTGIHASADCEECHRPTGEGDLQWLGAPTDCFECHVLAYEATTAPDHAANGFPPDCAICHGTVSWAGGYFNHDVLGGSLVCYECHQDDYDGTTDPDHAASGFPIECGACHGTRHWEGATFDHDGFWFPIDSGTHREEWDDCSDCHVNAGDYGVFSCLGCHPHSDRAKTDDDHSEENGYLYDSVECYECHPDGRS